MKTYKMNENSFDLQVICQGAYLDKDGEDSFLIETKIFKLNHIALNEWTLSEMLNSRECYPDGKDGDNEWAQHQAEYTEKRRMATEHILDALHFDEHRGSVSITQNMAEIFTAVRISRI